MFEEFFFANSGHILPFHLWQVAGICRTFATENSILPQPSCETQFSVLFVRVWLVHCIQNIPRCLDLADTRGLELAFWLEN